MLSIVDNLLQDDFFRSGGDAVYALSPTDGIGSFQSFRDALCGFQLGDQGVHRLQDRTRVLNWTGWYSLR